MENNKIKIIDSHTHLQFESFDKDRGEVIKRALEHGIGTINAGADIESSKKAVEIAGNFSYGVWATSGIHPTEMTFKNDSELKKSIDDIKNIAKEKSVVAIGECGLDYFHQKEEKQKEIQRALFLEQIKISNELKKPLVVHCREAFPDLLEVLTLNKNLLLKNPGIIHFFTGTLNDAKKLLELNFSFTFGGLITFNRTFDEIIKYISIENILVETDAPFVSPQSHRGQRNEPIYIEETTSSLAQIKDIDEDILKKTLLQNTTKIFSL